MSKARHREIDVHNLRGWERLLIRMTPACTRVTRTISESFERPLSLKERVQLRLHFLICAWCLRWKVQLQLLHHGLAANSHRMAETVAGSLSDDARARMKARLLAEPIPAANTAPSWGWRFAAVPVAAVFLSLASMWSTRLVEFEGARGFFVVGAHYFFSWAFFAGRAMGIITETPHGFPICCFIGWTAAGVLAVAGWAIISQAGTESPQSR